MKYLFPVLLLLPIFSQAQTFFVSGHDHRSRDHVIEKIKYEGYNITQDSASADYIVHMLIDGDYKYFSVKRSYSGYIKIVDNHTGEEVGRTREVRRNPAALNGYNAAWTIFTVICKKYLGEELKKCKPLK